VARPSGTVTFLFSDIEGSSRSWERAREQMSAALARHDALVRRVMEDSDGYVFKSMGDEFCVAFAAPEQAVGAAVATQRALGAESWPEGLSIQVRMALHTGHCEERDSDYFGPPVNRVARLEAIASGGQVVLSQATSDLVADSLPPGVTLVDLGEHQLKDLQRPEHVFQLAIDGLQHEFPALRSLSNPDLRHNLPRQLSSFVGRAEDVRVVAALLGSNRLVTLTGPGGCGKTRLALQVAAELLDGSGDGVWFVDLASQRDERFVAQAAAAAIGVRADGDTDMLEVLAQSIGDREMLIVLDNCEHLIEPCAKLSDRLLRSCQNLTILSTSREPLGIDGERPYRVPSLGLPPTSKDVDAESVATCEAVRLLVERARVHDPGFEVDAQNARAIAEICERLDGIPLALELVASRLSVMTPEDVERRLGDRFRLLAGANRIALPRQQTLQASLDWSYDLLNDAQRRALMFQSVFVGSYDLAAAEAVVADGVTEDYEVAEILRGLVDRSLVIADAEPRNRRFRLGETVREYAGRRLLDLGVDELLAARDRHAEHYDRLVMEELEPPLVRTQSVQEALERERLAQLNRPNVRAALDHTIVASQNLERTARLAVLFGRDVSLQRQMESYAFLGPVIPTIEGTDPRWLCQVEYHFGTAAGDLGHSSECEEHLIRAADLAAASHCFAVGVRIAYNRLLNAFRRGDTRTLSALISEAMALAEESGDPSVEARARGLRATFGHEGKPQARLEDLQFTVDFYERHHDESGYWPLVEDLALLELECGKLTEARSHLEGALASGAGEGDYNLAAHLNLAIALALTEELVSATQHWRTAADSAESANLGAYFWPVLIVGAFCCSALGSDEQAAILHGAATQRVDDSDEVFEPLEAWLREEDLRLLSQRLGQDRFDRAFARGRVLSFEDALALARDAMNLD